MTAGRPLGSTDEQPVKCCAFRATLSRTLRNQNSVFPKKFASAMHRIDTNPTKKTKMKSVRQVVNLSTGRPCSPSKFNQHGGSPRDRLTARQTVRVSSPAFSHTTKSKPRFSYEIRIRRASFRYKVKKKNKKRAEREGPVVSARSQRKTIGNGQWN